MWLQAANKMCCWCVMVKLQPTPDGGITSHNRKFVTNVHGNISEESGRDFIKPSNQSESLKQ